MLTAAARKHKAMQCDANIANINTKATRVRRSHKQDSNIPGGNEAQLVRYAATDNKTKTLCSLVGRLGGRGGGQMTSP